MLKSINKKTKLLHVKKEKKKERKTTTWYLIELMWLFFTRPHIKFEFKRNWVELKPFKNAKINQQKNQITTHKIK